MHTICWKIGIATWQYYSSGPAEKSKHLIKSKIALGYLHRVICYQVWLYLYVLAFWFRHPLFTSSVNPFKGPTVKMFMKVTLVAVALLFTNVPASPALTTTSASTPTSSSASATKTAVALYHYCDDNTDYCEEGECSAIEEGGTSFCWLPPSPPNCTAVLDGCVGLWGKTIYCYFTFFPIATPFCF
jgi:hypothetical protein